MSKTILSEAIDMNDVTSDIEEEELDHDYIVSDHSTESELTCSDDDDDNPIPTDSRTSSTPIPLTFGASSSGTVTSKTFYGKNNCYKWVSTPASRGRTLASNIIMHLPGLKGDAKKVTDQSPMTFWNLLMTQEMLGEILRRTNEKMASVQIKPGSKLSYIGKTDLIELKAVIGLLYLSAISKSNHEDFRGLYATDGTGRSIFPATMSMKRLLFILLCLRFDDGTTRCERVKTDKSAAISWLFNSFINNCQANISIGEYATVDEMLVGFRGRCGFRMFIKSKPRKYGIKIFIMTDARTHYCLNAKIYTGKDKEPNPPKALLKSTQVVLELVKPIENTNRNLTGDNWFTSIQLVEELRKKKITYVGTMNKVKKEIPPEFKPHKNREAKSVLYGYAGLNTLISYVPKVKRAVVLLSTMHHQPGHDEEVDKPEIVSFYNMTKGGVDALDQKCANYSTSRRTQRWPMAIFYAILDISGVNSHILQNSTIVPTKMDRRTFLHSLGMSLIREHMERRLTVPTLRKDLKISINQILGIGTSAQQPQVPQPQPPSLSKRKRCSICPSKNDRKTSFACIKCNQPICLACAEKICPNCCK